MKNTDKTPRWQKRTRDKLLGTLSTMHGFSILLVIFLVVPLVEVYLLVQVGAVIGALPTVLAVVGTAVLGAGLVRLQGLQTLARVQQELASGRPPAMAMLEGLFILVAGALLLTPGFFTDAVGFVFLAGPLRRSLIRWALARLLPLGPGSRPGSGPGPRASKPSTPHTLEGEFQRKDD